MSSIWEDVKKLAIDGQRGIIVSLTPGNIVQEKSTQRGRPKVLAPDTPFQAWIDPRSKGVKRPYCLRVGCRNHLRKNDLGVCSDECAEMLKVQAMQSLQLLAQREERLKNANGEANGVVRPAHAGKRAGAKRERKAAGREAAERGLTERASASARQKRVKAAISFVPKSGGFRRRASNAVTQEGGIDSGSSGQNG